jgi:hypothetical protein
MDVKDRQQTVVEFLLFKGCASEKSVMRFRNLYGSDANCRASVFRWISEVRRGNEEFRNEGRLGRPIDTKLCGDSVDSTRRSEGLTENYCRNSTDFGRDGSHAYVADRLRSEEFTIDSLRADL